VKVRFWTFTTGTDETDNAVSNFDLKGRTYGRVISAFIAVPVGLPAFARGGSSGQDRVVGELGNWPRRKTFKRMEQPSPTQLQDLPGIPSTACLPRSSRSCRRTASTPTCMSARTAGEVPQDLYKQDWWYRTVFTAPAGLLQLHAGISGNQLSRGNLDQRAKGRRQQASRRDVCCARARCHQWIQPGSPNVLAVKVTPEQLIQDVDGVELADSWFDWINWKYLGYKGKFTKELISSGFPLCRIEMPASGSRST
jgi:hypothetical protein